MHTKTGLLDFGSPAQLKSIELRRKVLRVPLGLDFTETELLSESDQFHFALCEKNEVLAILLLKKESSEKYCLRMRQVAVEPGLQGKGVGSELVRASELWALESGFHRICLHARLTAVSFYEKLGYHKTGDVFTEVGIPHIAMYKNLK